MIDFDNYFNERQEKVHCGVKERIKNEFSKIIPMNILENCVEEIYKLDVYLKDDDTYEVILFPEALEKKNIVDAIDNYFNTDYEFYKKQNNEDKHFHLPIEDELNNKNTDNLYWCSMPEKYELDLLKLDSDSSYQFALIKFNKRAFKKYFYRMGAEHEYIRAIKLSWAHRWRNRNYDELFKFAAMFFNKFLSDNSTHFDVLSTLKYESEINKGSIVFIETNHSENESEEKLISDATIFIKLKDRVAIRDYKRMRKLLQMTNEHISLLINDNYEAFALGRVGESIKNYKVSFTDYLHWILYKDGQEYLAYSNFIPYLPIKNNYRDELRFKLEQTFIHFINDKRIERIVNLINKATEQRKGTMVIISDKAFDEIDRLCHAGIPVEGTFLSADVVKLATSIDGAIFIDLNSRCYGLGVILDGAASVKGDPSRGARYNSALRYIGKQMNEGNNCLAVVISEDKYVDILSTSD